MKSTNLSCCLSLCSIFCLMLLVQSANAQTDRTTPADPAKNPAPPINLGAAPAGDGVAARDQKLKDNILVAIQAYNAEQKSFGYQPICSDAELKNLLSGDFVTKLKGILAGPSATAAATTSTTVTSAAPTFEIKNNGPGFVTLGFADGTTVQIVPKESRSFQGHFGNVRLSSSDSDWANIEIVGRSSEFSFMDGDDQKTYDLKPGQSFKRDLGMGKKHYILQPK